MSGTRPGPYRSDMCGSLGAADAGRAVRLAGWVHRRRDMGGVVFLDLRDREGLVQVVARPDGPDGPDGIEPGSGQGAEAAYDVARRMQAILSLRHRVIRAIRAHYDAEGFIEVETPMLTKSTPEGARDFLVPSRLDPGKFFALPQSPQLFKQLLMVAGTDRYYQIVRCFRDEDPRADRQPDFTQLDVEMSFVDEEGVRVVTEAMLAEVFRAAHGVELQLPLLRLAYDDAMERYGTDKPDLRFGLEIVDLGPVFATSGVQVFRRALDARGAAKGRIVAGGYDGGYG